MTPLPPYPHVYYISQRFDTSAIANLSRCSLLHLEPHILTVPIPDTGSFPSNNQGNLRSTNWKTAHSEGSQVLTLNSQTHCSGISTPTIQPETPPETCTCPLPNNTPCHRGRLSVGSHRKSHSNPYLCPPVLNIQSLLRGSQLTAISPHQVLDRISPARRILKRSSSAFAVSSPSNHPDSIR